MIVSASVSLAQILQGSFFRVGLERSRKKATNGPGQELEKEQEEPAAEVTFEDVINPKKKRINNTMLSL